MGEPTVRRANEGFFTRLGRAIDAFNGEDRSSAAANKQTNKQTNAEAVKPLPKKYAATSSRVVRGAFGGGYVAKALKLAADMRALAVEEDHWYNRTKASDVDEVVNKYKPMIQSAGASQKKGLAEKMLAELFDTPTGNNVFSTLRFGYGSDNFFNCYTVMLDSRYETREFGSKVFCTKGAYTSCTIGGVVTKIDDTSYCSSEGRPSYLERK